MDSELANLQLVNGHQGAQLKGKDSCFSRLGKALPMKHREVNLMRLSFLATRLSNLDLPDTSMGYFYAIPTLSFFSRKQLVQTHYNKWGRLKSTSTLPVRNEQKKIWLQQST
jgi:hypothetical protein